MESTIDIHISMGELDEAIKKAKQLTEILQEANELMCSFGLRGQVREGDGIGVTEISLKRIDSRSILQIGQEGVEISDYIVKSSADGNTELTVTIIGSCSGFELSASLEEQAQGGESG